jgi:hypothetical protein
MAAYGLTQRSMPRLPGGLESCKAKDFEPTYRAAEFARLAFLRAREALKVHIALHGCERSE